MMIDINDMDVYRLPEDACRLLYGNSFSEFDNPVRATRYTPEELISGGINPELIILKDIYSLDGSERLGGILNLGTDLSAVLVQE
ncbi:MAG: hypothetical protein Q8Q35_04165 [Nanoarchaeota archaeon]|nr:hypothetical protein [Nanoarchaeota archaeon]